MALMAAYLAIAVLVRVNHVLLLGSAFSLPGPLGNAPGLGVTQLVTEPVTVLVLGLDRRPSEQGEQARSDSIMILRFDPKHRTSAVLSIPRDLWVDLPNGRGGTFKDRINTAYPYGEVSDYPGGGAAAARDTVERLLPGVEIDYYAVIDFATFVKAVDTLGGIEVNVTEPFSYDEAVSVDGGEEHYPVFQAGRQKMDGEQALYYSRYRGGPDGDFGRIRRQQEVMQSVMTKALTVGAVTRAPELWSRFRGSVETDIPAYRVPGLALAARDAGNGDIRWRSLGEIAQPWVTPGGADVLLAERTDIAQVMATLFTPPGAPNPATERARVEVQNGAGVPGLARATAQMLVDFGLDVDFVTAADAGHHQDLTEVVSRGAPGTAQQVARWLDLPSARIRQSPAGSDGAEVIVVLGDDAKMPSTRRP